MAEAQVQTSACLKAVAKNGTTIPEPDGAEGGEAAGMAIRSCGHQRQTRLAAGPQKRNGWTFHSEASNTHGIP